MLYEGPSGRRLVDPISQGLMLPRAGMWGTVLVPGGSCGGKACAAPGRVKNESGSMLGGGEFVRELSAGQEDGATWKEGEVVSEASFSVLSCPSRAVVSGWGRQHGCVMWCAVDPNAPVGCRYFGGQKHEGIWGNCIYDNENAF